MQRVAALDLGEARVGLAVSDELGKMAHPRDALAARPRPKLLEALRSFAAAEGISRWIIGLPLDMHGGEGDAASKARELAQAIADATGIAVELVDERLTTVQAARSIADSGKSAREAKEIIDSAAATVILQSWLDRA